MKIWPFDEYAERSNGTRIAPADLKRALVPFEKIRRAVGDDMDIHVEFHSLWDLPTAIEIAQALAPYRPYWFEDPIKMTNLDALADYRRRTNVRVTASETLGTRWAFRELFERQAVERGDARRRLVRRHLGGEEDRHDGRGLSPTDRTARLHRPGRAHRFGASRPQLRRTRLVQEVVRAFYSDWYRELVTELPPLDRGFITAPEGPGLGIDLLPDLVRRPDATVRTSRL